MQLNKQSLISIFSILVIVIVWGSASTVTKLAVEDIQPYTFAFLRNLVGSICFVPFYFYLRKRNRQGISGAPVKKLIWLGLTGITFFYLFFNAGIYYTTAAIGALIQGFIPIAIILLAVLFLKERLKLLQAIGILISLGGVIMIGFTGVIGEARNAILGNILIIFAVISWGAYTIISKSMQQYNPVYLAIMSIWIGTIGLILPLIYELCTRGFPVISTDGWLSIIYLGIFSSTICYILYNRILKILPAVQVGNFMNLDPLCGAIIAIIFLHDRVTVWQVTGTILVLVGVALTTRKRK
jgi:drug/metabolite transporter (DMT)-like permease